MYVYVYVYVFVFVLPDITGSGVVLLCCVVVAVTRLCYILVVIMV